MSYLALFPAMIYLQHNQQQYTYPQDTILNNYNSRENARKYFLPVVGNTTFVSDGYAPDYNWLYDYLDTTLHQRLWLDDAYSPYTSIGSLRMI